MAEGFQVLNVDAAAEMVGVEPKTIREWITQRGCPCVTKKPYILEAGALRAWMAKNIDESGSFPGGNGNGGNHAKKAAALEAATPFAARAGAGAGDEPTVQVPTTGDELMALDGVRIGANLDALLRRYSPGDEVEFSLFRDGILKTVPVTLNPVRGDFEIEVDEDAGRDVNRMRSGWLGGVEEDSEE